MNSLGDFKPQVPVIELMGMQLASMTRTQLLDHIFAELAAGRGGWIVTANLDFLRRAYREHRFKSLYAQADIRVADGMPLVWASGLQGARLPERIAGSSIAWLLLERAKADSRSVCLLGGAGSANAGALAVIREKLAGLDCTGASPIVASPPTPDDVEAVRSMLGDSPPDILLVGLGSPKQEELIAALRPLFPKTWMIGVGITFSFLSGELSRAPKWLQRIGGEWLFRLFQDPKRLGKRYLLEDLPFALRLFPHALLRRFQIK